MGKIIRGGVFMAVIDNATGEAFALFFPDLASPGGRSGILREYMDATGSSRP